MVATRRSGAKTAPLPHIPPRLSKRKKITVSGTAVQTGKPAAIQPSILRTSSPSTNSTTPIRPSSGLSELTLTSPSTGRAPHHDRPAKIDHSVQVSVEPSTEQVVAVLKKRTTPGNFHNPIVLLEDSLPSNIQETAKAQRTVEPHRFQDRHSKLYTYKASRPALAPIPANGTTFTGHSSHDMYRMQTANTAPLDWNVGRPQQARPDLSFEMQYPISTQYLASQTGTAFRLARPNIQYFPPLPPSYPHHAALMPLNEHQLRSKALQYVRENWRSSPRKRKIAEDPDETSESDSTEVDQDATYPSQTSSSNNKPKSRPVVIPPSPHFQLDPLIEQASLLTSLLCVYPRSADQKGLREDIEMLASVQNQRLADWLSFEVGQSRKIASPHTPRVSRDSAASLIKTPLTADELAEAERKRKQDDEVRSLLSANANMWQDGSGLGVADVYSDARAPTPQKAKTCILQKLGR